MTQAKSELFRGAQLFTRVGASATEHALAYVALTQLLSLTPSRLYTVQTTITHAVLSLSFGLAIVFGLSTFIMLLLGAIGRTSTGALSTTARAILPRSGCVGLIAGTFIWGLNEKSPGLVFGCVVAGLMLADRVRRGGNHDGRDGDSAIDYWATALLVSVSPFLAQARPPLRLTGVLPAVLAVGFAAVLAMTARRLRENEALVKSLQRVGVRVVASTAAVATALGSAYAFQPKAPATAFSHSPMTLPRHHTNVILITLDTVRADHTSLYSPSRDTTPHLVAFHRTGATLYRRAISASDHTLASHASIMTGLLPSHHGAHVQPDGADTPLPARLDTVAARLREEGYLTAGIVGNGAYLRSEFGFATGFDYFDARLAQTAYIAASKRYFLTTGMASRVLERMGPDFGLTYRAADAITDEALSVVRQAKDTVRPLFLFVNYMDAHDPYVAPAAVRRRFGVTTRRGFWQTDFPRLRRQTLTEERPPETRDTEYLVANYDAAIAFVDQQIGRLLTGLERSGRIRDSLVIVVGDHGEMFGESGIIGHGAGVFRELVDVPLLVKFPHADAASVVENIVSPVDILPTILDTLGLAVPDRIDGEILPRASRRTGRRVVSESFELRDLATVNARFRGEERAAFSEGRQLRVMRDGRIEDSGPNDGASTWTRETVQILSALDNAARATRASVPLAPDVVEKLKALGYVGR